MRDILETWGQTSWGWPEGITVTASGEIPLGRHTAQQLTEGPIDQVHSVLAEDKECT